MTETQTAILALSAAWLAYFLLHSLLASLTVKRWVAPHRKRGASTGAESAGGVERHWTRLYKAHFSVAFETPRPRSVFAKEENYNLNEKPRRDTNRDTRRGLLFNVQSLVKRRLTRPLAQSFPVARAGRYGLNSSPTSSM